jgi:hypothetical protein
MRIFMATYVPLRTCSQMCKLLLCGLVLSVVLLNLLSLLKRPSRLDSADEYSEYSIDGSVGRLAKIRRGNPRGFVERERGELEAQFARGERWRRRAVGVVGAGRKKTLDCEYSIYTKGY